jgi:hypothetical protein
MAIEPSVWGPYLWRSIHFIALGYPNSPSSQDAEAYKAFFQRLESVIPCQTCALNYERHLREYPVDPYLGSTESLFRWTVILHNAVNRETGKPEMSFDEAWAMYAAGGHDAHLAATGRPSRPVTPDVVYVLTVAFLILALTGGVFYVLGRRFSRRSSL